MLQRSFGLGLDSFLLGFDPIKCWSRFLLLFFFFSGFSLMKLVYFFFRRHKVKKEEAEEPEVDPERDQRTVFAYQAHYFS